MKVFHPRSLTLILLISFLLFGCATAPSATSEVDALAAPTAAVAFEPTSLPEPTPEPAAEATLASWEVLLESELSHASRMIAFYDAQIGVSAGPTGSMTHFTTDGGQTWTQAETSQRCAYSVDIVGQDVIWQCNKMNVSLSTDGGANWELKGESKHNCALSFADAQTGWLFTPGMGGLFRQTTDGGENWIDLTLPDGVTEVAALELDSPNAGYLLDYEGNLYITQDGAQSWQTYSLGLEAYGELKMLKIEGRIPAAIHFSDADKGLIVLSLAGGGDSKLVALYTHDGGATWGDEETIPSEIGIPNLTQEGNLLTIYPLSGKTVTVFQNTGE